MNILQISNKGIFPPDGGNIATFNLTKSFASLGHNVYLLTMLTYKHSNKTELIPKELKHKIILDGISINTKPSIIKILKNFIASKLPYNAERFISIKFKTHLIQILNTNSFDIIQLEGLYSLLYLSDIKKHSKALISYRPHNIEHNIWTSVAKEKHNILIKIYLNILSKRIFKLEEKHLNKYDVIIPISENDALFYKNSNCTVPLHVATGGINISDFDAIKSQTTNNSLFYIGALDWQPNQNGILWFIKTVWPKINKENKNIKFYIAGRNAPKWFEKKISKENIIYLGEIDDAYSYIKSNTIMLIPLFSGSGIRIKIIEGMALRKTIISTSMGATGIPYTNKKDILIANTKNEFINYINLYINNKKQQKNIGDNAYKLVVENFNNLSIAKSVINFYNKNL